MMLVFILLLALVLVGAIFLLARRRSESFAFDNHLDVQAFQNLVDPDEIAVLRDSVSSAAFRRLQRQRARIALRYLNGISANASGLMHISSATESSRPDDIAELEREAMQVRVLVWRARAAVMLWFAFPHAQIRPTLAGRYAALRGHYEQMLHSDSHSTASAI